MKSLSAKQVSALVLGYLHFKRSVIHMGYAAEIDWQDRQCLNKISEQTLLKEFAWVVLSSGMNYKVISKLFDRFSEVFYNWNDATIISENANQCKKSAMLIFGNQRKIDAIVSYCSAVAKNGVEKMKRNIREDGIGFIQSFPYMGEATAYHYAKNIGLDVVKPDRHLVRISAKLGFSNPGELCAVISSQTADKLSVIDLVYWRYATLDRDYLDKLRISC